MHHKNRRTPPTKARILMWTTMGKNGPKQVGWETKRHPESGNSLSAYHHLMEADDGFA